MKFFRMTILCVCISLTLFGCSKGKAVDENDKQSTDNTPAKEEVVNYNPLNGLETDEVSSQRPVAVMINNHKAARPQSGLQSADIIYEVIAEGNITRFLAIYQSEIPDRIGPVRSARDYYIKLAKGYDALFICHGYSPAAKKMLSSGEIDNLNGLFYDGTLFKRDKSRVAPHNSYITADGIVEGAKKNNYSLKAEVKPLTFAEEGITFDSSWKDGSKIAIKYSNDVNYNVTYSYEEASKEYVRIQNDVVATDKETEQELQIKNVIIVEAEHHVIDSAGRNAIDITSGGNGYYYTEGKGKAITWKNVNNRIIAYDENGKEIELSPGQTWINFVPSLNDVTIE